MQIEKQLITERQKYLRFTSWWRYLRIAARYTGAPEPYMITYFFKLRVTEGKMETSLDRHGNTILPPATLSGFAASGHSIGTKQILNTCSKTPPHDPISV
ncbi:hypothetical protein F2Q68_00008607 [Brassica cretica]|uniref:Uncharacterized protein n=1 Tax=Brassica cretica TaxID=69181 RepID=A0A3N6QXU3_BRACR|nr:hypothetical protein F2Q68_00008607 [Brassica cretica]